MDNEHGCGLDCGAIAGSLVETLQEWREHARSEHVLTWSLSREETDAALLPRVFVSSFTSVLLLFEETYKNLKSESGLFELQRLQPPPWDRLEIQAVKDLKQSPFA